MNQIKQPKQSTHRPLLETLESRQLFSGSVTVTYDAPTDTFTVIGDGKFNSVQVRHPSVGSGKKYVITGLNSTLINGQASITVAVGLGNSSGFRVGLGGGNDLMLFDAGGYYDDVFINTGSGDDEVRTPQIHTWGDLTIDTGSGADNVEIWGPSIAGDLTVNTGSGNDTMSVVVMGNGSWVQGDTLLDGGDDRDALTAVIDADATILNVEHLDV